MDNYEYNSNRTNPNEITEQPKKIGPIKKNELIKKTVTNKATSRIEECNISSFEEIDPDIIEAINQFVK